MLIYAPTDFQPSALEGLDQTLLMLPSNKISSMKGFEVKHCILSFVVPSMLSAQGPSVLWGFTKMGTHRNWSGVNLEKSSGKEGRHEVHLEGVWAVRRKRVLEGEAGIVVV